MSWLERVRRFEQTASRARLMAAGFALGGVLSVLFAPLHLTGLTWEDVPTYIIGVPLVGAGTFVFVRIYVSARQWIVIFFVLACLPLLAGFISDSHDRILNDRGERTVAVVTQVINKHRNGIHYRLAKPNGEAISGDLSQAGSYDVGDHVDVVADPAGKADPVLAKDIDANATLAPHEFILFCAPLLAVTTWAAATVHTKRRRLPPPPVAPYGPPPGGFGPPPGPNSAPPGHGWGPR
ncbi:hypothetical protein [Streptomyces boninensis]|uniref:hypothetical protein n=1 Tax=Streptomyces boninensis TaxID=2039455 RepID=UPI003B228076